MNRREKFSKYDWLMSKIQSVLSHYTCPEYCNASCCKNHEVQFVSVTIGFPRKEYEKILKHADSESVKIVKEHAAKSIGDGYHKMIQIVDACPLLIGLKCRIYDLRPEPCRKFPFET